MRNFLLLVCFTFMVSLSSAARAANYDDPIDGIFKSASGDSITIQVHSTVSKSPESNRPIDGDLMFQINSNTGYSNFHQLSDLKEGDHVRVEYVEDPNGKMKRPVATMITDVAPVTSTTVVVAPSAGPPTTTTTTTTTTTVNSE